MEGVQGKTRDVLPCRRLEGTLGVTSWGLGVGSEQKDRCDGWKSRFQGLGKLEGGDTCLNFSILRRGRRGPPLQGRGFLGSPSRPEAFPTPTPSAEGRTPEGRRSGTQDSVGSPKRVEIPRPLGGSDSSHTPPRSRPHPPAPRARR